MSMSFTVRNVTASSSAPACEVALDCLKRSPRPTLGAKRHRLVKRERR